MPKNYICTWLCADEKGEESIYPQVGGNSSDFEIQKIYWRCVLVFFITSKKFNPHNPHVFFTNMKDLPEVDGVNMQAKLKELGVEIRYVKFKHKTPEGYYHSWRNQFFEFSILELIAAKVNSKDIYLILDSDCVFTKPAAELFKEAASSGFLTYEFNMPDDYDMNGLTPLQMQAIYEDLLGKKLQATPKYYGGEILCLNGELIKKINRDFQKVWPILLNRFANKQLKFNEEAHTLSYLYYLHGIKGPSANKYLKQLWTDARQFRNIERKVADGLTIWHIPSEKRYGFVKLFELFKTKDTSYWLNFPESKLVKLLGKELSIYGISALRKREYRQADVAKLKDKLRRVKSYVRSVLPVN